MHKEHEMQLHLSSFVVFKSFPLVSTVVNSTSTYWNIPNSRNGCNGLCKGCHIGGLWHWIRHKWLSKVTTLCGSWTRADMWQGLGQPGAFLLWYTSFLKKLVLSRNGIYMNIHAVLKKIWPFSWAKLMRSRHVFFRGSNGSLFDLGGWGRCPASLTCDALYGSCQRRGFSASNPAVNHGKSW